MPVQNRPRRRPAHPAAPRRDPGDIELGGVQPAQGHVGAPDAPQPRPLLRGAVRRQRRHPAGHPQHAGPRPPHDPAYERPAGRWEVGGYEPCWAWG